MKYIKQIIILLFISSLGEILNYLIPFPIPGSIYGMILLFFLLCSGIIKLKQIKETSDFLIDIMPILFIPSAVGIMSQFEHFKTIWIQIIVITIFSTIIVMAVTGVVTQMIIHVKKGDNDENRSY